jgi:hypothetical protein
VTVETRHLHIHLGALEAGTELHIHIGEPDLEAGELSAEPAVAADGAEAVDVRAMLARMKEIASTGNMKASASADNIQAVYDGLAGLGYMPVAPAVREPGRKPSPYLRWLIGGRGKTVCSLNTMTLSFERSGDVARLKSYPGARPGPGYIRFPIYTREGVDEALTAARAVI